MRRMIGNAINTACRHALRAGLGLRLPAARIRQHDLEDERARVVQQIREALEETNHLIGELNRIDNEIAAQRADTARLQDKLGRLRVPAPTKAMEDL